MKTWSRNAHIEEIVSLPYTIEKSQTNRLTSSTKSPIKDSTIACRRSVLKHEANLISVHKYGVISAQLSSCTQIASIPVVSTLLKLISIRGCI